MTDSDKKMDKVMIFAGEASGDLQGAMLSRQLRHYNPKVEFSGAGGVRMKREGVKLILDSTTFGVVGAWEGLKSFPTLLKLYFKCRHYMIKTNPDLVIFIDTPAFNMRLAKIAKQHGIKSVYYFPPSAWSGNEDRAREVGNSVDAVVNTFKFSADTYDRAGVKHYYTGHPLVDFMNPWKTRDKNDILKEFNLDPEPTYVALLPGSRIQELKNVMPLLLKVGRKLREDFPTARFLIPIASPLLKDSVEKALSNHDLPVTTFDGKSPAVMAVSDLVIMASGSAALEACLLEKPMIITYRINPVDYTLIKTLLNIKWVGLPNLILQREVVPELIQENATVEKVCAWAKDLLGETDKRKQMISDLRKVNAQVGEPGVVERVARFIWENVV